MLVVVAVPGFNEGETGKRAVAQIGEELGESGATWFGSMQKEFVVSPTTLDGCVVPVQAAPVGFSYEILI